MKTLPGLTRPNLYDEHMGCIKGCLDFLGCDISLPWLYGGTAHAFMLNMNDTVFVDCAMAWKTEALFGLYPNLGFKREGLVYEPAMDDPASAEIFRRKQCEAWDFVRPSIDRGVPCYGWELSYIPSYYIITGYDALGYYYAGWNEGGPCPWDQMGTFDVRMVVVHAIERCPPATDEVGVKAALAEGLKRIDQPAHATTLGCRRTLYGLKRWKAGGPSATGMPISITSGWSAARWQPRFYARQRFACPGAATRALTRQPGSMTQCARRCGPCWSASRSAQTASWTGARHSRAAPGRNWCAQPNRPNAAAWQL